MKYALLAIAGSLLAALPAHAANCTSPVLVCTFEGSWAADGTAFGKPAHVTMRWQPVLEGKFARIDYRIETKGEGAQSFEGAGFYRPRDNGAYDGTWFDSQGSMHPLNAMLTGSKLVAHWGVKGKTYGRTSYALIGGNAIEVVDEIQDKKGAWKEFARNTLKKME